MSSLYDLRIHSVYASFRRWVKALAVSGYLGAVAIVIVGFATGRLGLFIFYVLGGVGAMVTTYVVTQLFLIITDIADTLVDSARQDRNTEKVSILGGKPLW